MNPAQKEHLDDNHVARERLFESDKSSLRRYAELVIGEPSVWKLIRYELLSMFVVPVPGALGLVLRRRLLPSLFRSVGRNPVFGRGITLRNAHLVTLGDDVFLDDRCLIDGRGAGEEGIVLGDRCIVHRGAVVMSKGGGIRIGAGTDIGESSSIVSQGGIEIGDSVKIAGGCRIGGGLVEAGSERTRYTNGPVRIGDSVTLFQNVLVLDGVEIGDRAFVGAGAVVRDDVAADTTLAPVHRSVSIPHGGANGPPVEAAEPAASTITKTLLAAIEELNETRHPDERLALSPDTRLLGGALDSLALVNFIVSAEARLERAGIHVDLAATTGKDPAALTTISTLAAFVARSGNGDH